MKHLLPVLSGLLFYLSFHPADLGPLAWFALVPLMVHSVSGPGGWRSFLSAWLGGAIFGTLGTLWVRHTVPFGPPGIGIYFGLYWALFSWGLRRLCRRAEWPLPIAAPTLWIALEFIRSHVLGGFPVLLAGYSQHAVFSLIQIADVGGVWLVSALVVMVNGAVAHAFVADKPSRRWAMAAAACAALAFAYGWIRVGTMRLEEGPKIGLIQPNIPQDVKNISFTDPAAARRIWRKHVEFTQRLAAQEKDLALIVWPETVTYESLAWDLEAGGWARDLGFVRLSRPARENRVWTLVGTQVTELRGGKAERYFNSAVLVDPAGEFRGRYDKAQLVQFSEYIPLGSVLPVKSWMKALTNLEFYGEFTPGTSREPLDAGGVRVGVSICGEVMYPEISRELAGKDPAALVNISNDGWFRDSAELDQMLIMARFRAIENRVPFLRATNTGISAFIDPDGRVRRTLAGPDGQVKEVEGVMAERIRTGGGSTPQRALGDWIAWLASGAVAAGMGLSLLRGRNVDRADGANLG